MTDRTGLRGGRFFSRRTAPRTPKDASPRPSRPLRTFTGRLPYAGGVPDGPAPVPAACRVGKPAADPRPSVSPRLRKVLLWGPLPAPAGGRALRPRRALAAAGGGAGRHGPPRRLRRGHRRGRRARRLGHRPHGPSSRAAGSRPWPGTRSTCQRARSPIDARGRYLMPALWDMHAHVLAVSPALGFSRSTSPTASPTSGTC